MSGLLLAFFSSFVATLLIIRFKHIHSHLSADSDLSGPQKFHTKIVPRIGGIAIAIGILFAILLRLKNTPNPSVEVLLLICAIPTFSIGLIEDLTKKISVRQRLFFTAISATLFVFLLQAHIVKLDIPGIDFILTIPLVGVILTIFAMTGLANAYNIIDGFNGLASMVGIITLLGIAYIGFVFNDPTIVYLSLVMTGAILGFFIWNYPRGLIFLGDGGAYLIGFWIAALSILLTYSHPEISPWFALLINGYPILETLFTIYRRKIHQGKSPGQPDGIHFHTLIYRRILMNNHRDKNIFSANSRTAPYFWVLAGVSITPTLLWWQSTPILIAACLIFIIFYVWLYTSIVKFRTPKWLHLEQ
ncbi:MAG: glycosyltransferase [Rhodoferax sp.]|nr:glycosyltransferase [Rhodoferax sp.]MCF8190621.1 glycosyltransferase [Polynucleobacter sp.]